MDVDGGAGRVRAAVGLWRWRRNPLRRTTDLVEAWVSLVALVLIVLAAPATGWSTGARVEETLHRAVRVQHEQRHHIAAVVVRSPRGPALSPHSDAGSEQPSRRRVVADWTAPDGSRHTGTVSGAPRASETGDRFRVWTDTQGRIVSRPMDRATATTHAALAGFASAAATAVLVEVARRLIVRRLVHRRYVQLDRAWAAAGPDWGRTGAGG
ncbi:hypothetical protein [Streptomyces sp. NPDC051219]|uniref:Rv1733c family protein n=1 Tax=Streptomyces sp. NPDC051219 TaxID=3155283 RepID=UPI0034433843